MYKTEHEIFNQYEALRKTYDYIMKSKEKIKEFINKTNFKSITFTGCGSSYSLCKSAAMSAKMRTGKPINAFAAGDLMINFDTYKDILRDTLLVIPSRSGSTSEVVNSVKLAKEKLQIPCVSICTCQDSLMSELADLSLEMPWAFDESVCQTRTVTNLYTANLMLIGIISNDNSLIEEIGAAIAHGDKHIQNYSAILKEISDMDSWNKAVVLADSELEGIAEEGALAFNEICQLYSNYYHILDVRHGPMVLINNKTLAIVVVSPTDVSYQADLIGDLKKKGAFVITVSDKSENIWGADVNITVPSYKNFSVTGIPFIFVPQALSYFKAVATGVNPDNPQGLDPWIKL